MPFRMIKGANVVLALIIKTLVFFQARVTFIPVPIKRMMQNDECSFLLCSSLAQVMGSATVESVSAMPATLATTATAQRRRPPASQTMGRYAAGGAAVCVAAVNVRSPEPSEIPVKNAPPAPMPVALRGTVPCRNTAHRSKWEG